MDERISVKNEADVREDIAAPLLRALGYVRGTENDITREHFLRYEALQLGRKKSNDLPLGGKADYLLTVAGAGRWVLETKPPDEAIDLNTIDQTISYARHPEVCGHYAAILNGRRFVLYDRSRSSNDPPLIDIEVATVERLVEKVESLLSPGAIRRDCGPPIVDLSKGVAKGFRSKVDVIGGEVVHVNNWWEVPSYVPQQVQQTMVADTAKLPGTTSTIQSGRIWRDEESRVRVRLKWNLLHQDMKPFMQSSKMEDFEYVCADSTISDDPQKPSIFELVGAFRFEAGQRIFNAVRWRSETVQSPLGVTVLCQATGFLSGDVLSGIGVVQYVMRNDVIPDPIVFCTEMKFSVRVDIR